MYASYLVLVCVSMTSQVIAAANWGYGASNGPSTWANGGYPECGGAFQSPINIEGGNVVRDLRPRWLDYDLVPSAITITNNGHTLSINGTGTKPRLIIRDEFVYEFQALHFHWGKTNNEGSEHALHGIKYPLEMHAVHKRVDNGVINDKEIIVVAVLFQISPLQRNFGLERFLPRASSVIKAETSVNVTPFPWSAVIPQFQFNFFVYRGSLTTPPCSQVVTFFVRNELAKVTNQQMAILRELRNEEKEELAGNFRPLQNPNGRNVFYVIP